MRTHKNTTVVFVLHRRGPNFVDGGGKFNGDEDNDDGDLDGDRDLDPDDDGDLDGHRNLDPDDNGDPTLIQINSRTGISIQEEFQPDFDWIFDWTLQNVKIVKNPIAGEAAERRDSHPLVCCFLGETAVWRGCRSHKTKL